MPPDFARLDDISRQNVLDLCAKICESMIRARHHAFRAIRDDKAVFSAVDSRTAMWKGLRKKLTTKLAEVTKIGGTVGMEVDLLTIQPGRGAFHRHLLDPNLGISLEVAVVCQGSGTAFLQDELRGDKYNATGLLGGYTTCTYRGDLGHAFTNRGDCPLVLAVIAVPSPPRPNRITDEDPRNIQYAFGVEFETSDYGNSDLPDALKIAMARTFESLHSEQQIA